jgi:hypothetical protein
MKKWSFIGLFALWLSACGGGLDVGAPLSQAQGTPASTTGKGTFTDASGATVHMQVTAYQYSDGTFKGQEAWGSTGTPASWHGGTPTCYAIVRPGESVFAGPITASSDPSLVGQYYVIDVIDGSKTVADQIGVEWQKDLPNCNNLRVDTLYPITGGSLTVR